MRIFTPQGGTLGVIYVRYHGRTEGVVEAMFTINPELAELGAVLPHGITAELPNVQTIPVAKTVSLWE